MQALRFLTASLLFLGLFASITPTATAQGTCDGTETFEDDANFQPPTGCWYTPSGMGTSVVNTIRPYLGSKSLNMPTGATGPTFTFNPVAQACTDGAPFSATWYFNLDDAPGAGAGSFRVGFGASSGGSGYAYIDMDLNENLRIAWDSQATTVIPTLVIASDTWYGVSLTVSCTAGAANDDVFATAWLASDPAGTTTGAAISDKTAVVGIGGTQFSAFTSAGSTSQYWLDNLATTYDDSRVAFCADPSIIDFDGNPATPTTTTGASDDYGYNYRRGGTFFDSTDNDPASLGLSTGFEYAGTSSESSWDYSAKSFLTGTKALHENITIEAGTDGQSSRFRVNYHTQSGANPDDTQKGNGLTTGHFADHVEAEFTENGNTWAVAFHYVDGGGARTQLGSSVNFGDSNDATNFVVWLDTRASADFTTTLTNEYGSNWYFSGGTLHADPFIAITTASAAQGPGGQDFAVLAIRYLDDIAGNPFLEDAVSDVWNVGYGTNAALTATLGLDENLQENRANTDDEGGLDSTCIFDDAGTAVLLGSSGATPESSLPQTPDDTGDDDGPTFFNGVTEAALMGFLGIVLAASFAASMNEKTGAGAAGLAIFATMGIWVAYYLNYFGIEVVVSLTVGFVAIIFIGIKSAVSGGET